MKSKLKVFMFPTLNKYNQYCAALIKSLQQEDVEIHFSSKETLIMPLFALIRKAGLPHIVHLHWIDIYAIKKTWLRSLVAAFVYIFQLLFIKCFRIKIVWTIHDYVNLYERFGNIDLVIRKLTVKCADSIIVHTRAALLEVANLYKLSNKEVSKISVVPHGNFIEQYPNTLSQAAARQQLGLKEGLFLFGFIGYVRPYKGVLQLIEAFRQINEEHVNLLIAGYAFENAFENTVRKAANGDSRIHLYLDFIENQELQVFLNAPDVIVFPFTRSLTSGSLILAMSFAKSIVTSDCPFVPEVLPPAGGLVYSNENSEGLINALREIQLIDDVVSMGQKNLERARDFDWEAIARSTANVYRDVLKDMGDQIEE